MKRDIIDNYNRLPVGKYQEILGISQDENLDGIDKQAGIISVLTDIPVEDILDLPIAEYSELAAKTKFLEGDCRGITSRIRKDYQLGQMVLVPVIDHRKISMSQYVDFQEYAKGGEKNLVQVLSCLMIPKGKRYNQDYDVIEVQNAIRDYMSVADVLSLTAFFLTSFKELMLNSLTCLRQEAMRIPELERRQMMLQWIKEQEDLLRTGGDGLPT